MMHVGRRLKLYPSGGRPTANEAPVERHWHNLLQGDITRPNHGQHIAPRAGLAQLVEHLICNQGVGSSSLSAGTINLQQHFRHYRLRPAVSGDMAMRRPRPARMP